MWGLFNSIQALKSPVFVEALRREPEIKITLSFWPLLIIIGSFYFDFYDFLIPDETKVGTGGGSLGWNFSR